MTDTTNPPAQGQILRPSELPTISRAKGPTLSTSLQTGITTETAGGRGVDRSFIELRSLRHHPATYK